MKKIKCAEADEMIFSAMAAVIKDEQHIERLKFKIYNKESLITLLDWFNNSDVNDIQIEFDYTYPNHWYNDTLNKHELFKRLNNTKCEIYATTTDIGRTVLQFNIYKKENRL